MSHVGVFDHPQRRQLLGKEISRAHNCRQLGDWLKELICMLVSSPTNSQEAPVNKVTRVSLPVCQPGNVNRSNRCPGGYRRILCC